jgi:tRNA modification GTPase
VNASKTNNFSATIAAIATPPGRGGVGIVRLSGPLTPTIAQQMIGRLPPARHATHAKFIDTDGSLIDEGLAIYFPNPHSFTGEDVLELQGHGGPIVMDRLLKRALQLGARLAKPGEFSERAFLNNKIDLTQAEAIADLIDATSVTAARCAIRSLQGEFSKTINELVARLIELRMMVEAAIDFPEEEIDFLAESTITQDIQQLIVQVNQIQQTAKQGALLREGITVVIAGEPNVGKSSLLNQLSGYDAAIVTDVPGTTRDILREAIQIDGIPIHIVDTAGLRQTEDVVEQEGMRRAKAEIKNADILLMMVDATKPNDADMFSDVTPTIPRLIVKNKIDLIGELPSKTQTNAGTQITISAKTGAGIDILKNHLKEIMGLHPAQESVFIARRRHLDILARVKAHLEHGYQQLLAHRAGELLAEDLRQAQQALTEITGEFSADDLLGKIFSQFCIGK